MSIFNQKLSDEGLLIYVWLALVFLTIFFIGILYQNSVKMRELQSDVWKQVNEQDKKITIIVETLSKDKDIMLEIVQQNKITEAAVARMEEKVIGLEKLAEKMEKTSDRISVEANNFQKSSDEFSKVMQSFTKAMSFKIKTDETTVKIEDPKTEETKTIEEPSSTPETVEESTYEEMKPVSKEGKRIWWTLGLIKRKGE